MVEDKAMTFEILPLGNMAANCYIIKDENDEIMVIDPGGDSEVLIGKLRKLGGNIKYIILTHAHVDHIGALDDLKKEFGGSVVLHALEEKALNDSEINLCVYFGAESPVTKADIKVDCADTLPFGNSIIKFIHTPGHTIGSMCIQYKNFLFSGDTLFNLSIGRTDFPGGNFDDITKSIKNKIYTLKGETIIYPGHGDKTTVSYEKENNPFVRG